MRLLQLRTDGSSLIDLHPNLTVVQGLDADARAQLVRAVEGLAAGVGTGHGLLEAHGVLFELSTEMLALLDVAAGDRSPVVTAADLPSVPEDPGRRARAAAERTLAEAAGRWQAAVDERDRALAEVAAARARLDDLEAQLAAAEADVAGRLDSVDERATSLDQAIERRRRLADDVAELVPQAARAAEQRDEVEATTEPVRAARDEAVARVAALAARLEAARAALAPWTEEAVMRATEDLARVEAAAEAEAAAERAAREAPTSDRSPADELEELVARLDEIDQRLMGTAAMATDLVRAEIERVRGLPEVVLVASPEATDLADQIDALPVPDPSAPAEPLDLAGARARLDDARQALLEAEQLARNPPLDRELVDRLEATHADLLDALDRADSRLGGGRARRRAEELRALEQEVLDQLGFGSYSDYMMGSSVRDVDRARTDALSAARADLAAAEQEWRGLQERTDAELRRAEALDQRRVLVERAQELLGRPVAPAAVVEELRALQVEAAPTGDPAAPLRAALEQVGLDLGGADLGRTDLLLVAEAWVEEAAVDEQRLDGLAAERRALEERRAELLASLEADGRDPADGAAAREARVAAARQAVTDAERAAEEHRRAAAEVEQLAGEHEAAVAAEQEASTVAAEADARLRSAEEAHAELAARLAEAEEALGEAMAAEAEAERLLAAHDSVLDPEQLAALRAKVAEVAGALDLRQAAAAEASEVHDRAAEEHQAAVAALDALQEAPAAGGTEPSVADEIEWNLLARLAAQRSVSLAGSMPLLLDDALSGLTEPELGRIMGRLERMADAVQVILITDAAAAAAWASLAGPPRAAVVTAQPA